MAFVGGIDLTVNRWDSTRHLAAYPLRRNRDRSSYGPIHDVQMAVAGEVARHVADLVRTRWAAATGQNACPKTDRPKSFWPSGPEAGFLVDTPVALARTASAGDAGPDRTEGATLTLDMLNGARSAIYIETQYLTARIVRGTFWRSACSKPTGPKWWSF